MHACHPENRTSPACARESPPRSPRRAADAGTAHAHLSCVPAAAGEGGDGLSTLTLELDRGAAASLEASLKEAAAALEAAREGK